MRLLASVLALKVVPSLRQAGRASLAELSHALDATPSSVQRALTILMEDGLVRASGAGRARAYELELTSPLLDAVERLAAAALPPPEYARVVGRGNPAIEFIGRTARELVVVFAKRSDAMAQSRAATAARTVAAALRLDGRLLDHDDARRAGPVNAALREQLAAGEVLFGDLDASVPDRSHHRRTAGIPLGRINPALGLPSPQTLRSLKQRHHVDRLRAFGSAVRDDFRPDSDVDIAVRFSPDAALGLEALEALERDLEGRLGRDVDAVREEDLHPAFRWMIRDEAVPL